MNYCDYDAIKHYPSGAFSQQYKTNLLDNVVEIEKDTSLNEEQIKSFLDCEYRTYKTQSPVVLYRLFGRYQKEPDDPLARTVGARMRGRFASTEFAESVIDAKMRLALDPRWANTKMYEAKLMVPTNVIISVGIVAPVELPTGTVLPGGADQIMLPFDWPKEWIQGYRRVSGRQLQRPPTYWPDEPQETAMGIDALFPKVCPMCCSSNVKTLCEDEQFDIIGCKGGKYTMLSKCMNPLCEYYW